LTHSYTKNIEEITIQADIIITALVPNYLKADMVKDGVVVIDVGITRVPDETKEKGYVITGDVDFENVKKSKFYYPCSWWSPYDDSDVKKIRCWQEK
jgi:methylenetetrahydrofolate dehydrogenase (NADP+)/methenyltetrahydrofolate cyclohydrolase